MEDYKELGDEVMVKHVITWSPKQYSLMVFQLSDLITLLRISTDIRVLLTDHAKISLTGFYIEHLVGYRRNDEYIEVKLDKIPQYSNSF